MNEMQEWNELSDKELHNFYSLSKILTEYINEDEMSGRFYIERESKHIYKIFVGKPCGKRSCGRYWC
jgi:hypothetical protein